jgi:hypothetical protein
MNETREDRTGKYDNDAEARERLHEQYRQVFPERDACMYKKGKSP